MRFVYSANRGRTSSSTSPNVAGSGCTFCSRCAANSCHHVAIPASNSGVTGSPSHAYSLVTSPIGSVCMVRKSMS